MITPLLSSRGEAFEIVTVAAELIAADNARGQRHARILVFSLSLYL